MSLTDFQRQVLAKLDDDRAPFPRGHLVRDLARAIGAPATNVRRTLCILRARGLALTSVNSFHGSPVWLRAPAQPITAAECATDPGLGRLGG